VDALVHGRLGRGICPSGSGSADSSGGRHAETRHPIEYVASNLCLGALRRQSSSPKSSANNGLVPIHGRLYQAPAVVARTPLPAHASMLCDRCNMPIALRHHSCSLIRNRRRSRRNDDLGVRVGGGWPQHRKRPRDHTRSWLGSGEVRQLITRSQLASRAAVAWRYGTSMREPSSHFYPALDWTTAATISKHLRRRGQRVGELVPDGL
jgi:hypothetical protein